jgi:hypothetical protein
MLSPTSFVAASPRATSHSELGLAPPPCASCAALEAPGMPGLPRFICQGGGSRGADVRPDFERATCGLQPWAPAATGNCHSVIFIGRSSEEQRLLYRLGRLAGPSTPACGAAPAHNTLAPASRGPSLSAENRSKRMRSSPSIMPADRLDRDIYLVRTVEIFALR